MFHVCVLFNHVYGRFWQYCYANKTYKVVKTANNTKKMIARL